MNTSTKILPFRANNGRDLRIGFEMRKKRRSEEAKEFVKRMKKTQEKTQMVSCWTINFGNISDIQNLIIIINGFQEKISSPDITTRSPVVYSRTLSE